MSSCMLTASIYKTDHLAFIHPRVNQGINPYVSICVSPYQVRRLALNSDPKSSMALMPPG